MINLRFAEYIATLIALVIVYFVSITISGIFQAWVAEKMGDDTPKDAGFMSMNPMMHFHPVGFILLILCHFGWGKIVPFNPSHIHGRNKMEKTLLMFLAEPIISLFMALIPLMILIGYFGSTGSNIN